MKEQNFIIKEKNFCHVSKIIKIGNAKGIILRKEDLDSEKLEVGDTIKIVWVKVKNEIQSKTSEE